MKMIKSMACIFTVAACPLMTSIYAEDQTTEKQVITIETTTDTKSHDDEEDDEEEAKQKTDVKLTQEPAQERSAENQPAPVQAEHSPVVKAADQAHSDLTYSLKKDGRNWKVGYETKNQTMGLKEYILDNESIENWTELFTIHNYFGITLDVDKYYDAFIRELQKMAPDSKIESRVISKDKNSLLGEWWIQDNSPNAQHELFRIITDGHDVAVIRYTTRKVSDLDNTRKTWEDILNNAQLSPPKAP